MDHEETGFRVKVSNEQVLFEFKEHYATEDAARKAIEDYIRAWEFDACLRGGPNYFKLKFDHAQVEDQNPTPGVVELRGQPLRIGVRLSKPTLKVSPPCYPPPPSGLKLTPDVQTMYDRYMGYRQGREPLPGMAFFCWTVLQFSAGRRKGGSKEVGEKYRIDREVLNKIARLSSERGGQQARTGLQETRRGRYFLQIGAHGRSPRFSFLDYGTP